MRATSLLRVFVAGEVASGVAEAALDTNPAVNVPRDQLDFRAVLDFQNLQVRLLWSFGFVSLVLGNGGNAAVATREARGRVNAFGISYTRWKRRMVRLDARDLLKFRSRIVVHSGDLGTSPARRAFLRIPAAIFSNDARRQRITTSGSPATIRVASRQSSVDENTYSPRTWRQRRKISVGCAGAAIARTSLVTGRIWIQVHHCAWCRRV